jgi:hypothetical protein
MLDNTDRRCKSAAESLNHGGRKSNGEYIMFVHQDVKLADNNWLNRVEETLKHIHDLGVAGCAGIDGAGKVTGCR